jgi:hypothetical protein
MALGQLTYLQLCNRVLMRLGKSQLTSFTGATGDTWGGIVKDFINDAQREVAKEHDWSTLVTSGTFTTSSRTYDLSATFSNFGREIALIDTDNRVVLEPHSLRELDDEDPDQSQAGPPTRYAINYPNLLFNRTPSAVDFRLRYVKRATDLSAVGDVSGLPEYCDMVLVWWAVWQLAASREDSQDRGETARSMFDATLARAIGQDRRRVDRLFRLQPLFPAWGVSSRAPVNLGASYPPV